MSTHTVTKHDLAALNKAKQEADFRLMNATIEYRMQKEKAKEAPASAAKGKDKKKKTAAKKREAPATAVVAAPAEEAAPKKPKEKKAPKEKPVGWLCEGNILAATECPLAPGDQVYVGQTNHAKKKHNLCKACKKAYNTAKKAAGAE